MEIQLKGQVEVEGEVREISMVLIVSRTELRKLLVKKGETDIATHSPYEPEDFEGVTSTWDETFNWLLNRGISIRTLNQMTRARGEIELNNLCDFLNLAPDLIIRIRQLGKGGLKEVQALQARMIKEGPSME